MHASMRWIQLHRRKPSAGTVRPIAKTPADRLPTLPDSPPFYAHWLASISGTLRTVTTLWRFLGSAIRGVFTGELA